MKMTTQFADYSYGHPAKAILSFGNEDFMETPFFRSIVVDSETKVEGFYKVVALVRLKRWKTDVERVEAIIEKQVRAGTLSIHTEEDSACLKQFIKNHVFDQEPLIQALKYDISYHFPLEYDEAFDELFRDTFLTQEEQVNVQLSQHFNEETKNEIFKLLKFKDGTKETN